MVTKCFGSYTEYSLKCMDYQACLRLFNEKRMHPTPRTKLSNYRSTSKSSSSTRRSTNTIIVTIVIAFIICAVLIITVCICHSRRRSRQTSQTLQTIVHRITDQSEETRNLDQIVMVILDEERDNTVPQTLANEPPSYEDVVRLSTHNYDGTPSPPRYKDIDVPPPHRYEDIDVPPHPRYEDIDVPPHSRYEDIGVPPPSRYEHNDVPPLPRYEHNDVAPTSRYDNVVNEGNATTSSNNSAPRVTLC